MTRGGIFNKLLLVSLPVMGSQFIQMLYNLTDMFWLGRVGQMAVAASGTVGMYLWLSVAFIMFGRMGAEIGVSQNTGRKDMTAAQEFAQAAFLIGLILGVAYAAVMLVFRGRMIGFFGIRERELAEAAESYLAIVSLGMPFTFITGALTGVFTGSGNSKLPFYINFVGLGLNMTLDPLLILGLDMGLAGAAIATVIAQAAAGMLMIGAMLFYKGRPFARFRFFTAVNRNVLGQIVKWAAPIAVESFLFCFLSMMVTRFAAAWGQTALSVRHVGAQIESLSWLIAGGFGSALTAFTGQNFGAGKYSRIHRGYQISTAIMLVWGVVITLILFFGPRVIYNAFLPGDREVAALGVSYLRILSACQLTACLEAIAGGAFRGMGRTLPPSLVSVVTNALKVVCAYWLMNTGLGLNGIWWAVSITTAARGICIFIWYYLYARQLPRTD